MLIEAVSPTDVHDGHDYTQVARVALAQALGAATRPGISDPRPAMSAALTQALHAVGEALDAHDEDAPGRSHLLLAFEEIRDGIEQLSAPTADSRTIVLRHARLADAVLAEVLAMHGPDAGIATEPTPAR